jgi:hypothetical protein
MFKNLRDEVIFIICLIVLFVIGGMGIFLFDKYSCSQVSRVMNVDNYFSISTGCMVNYKGQWIPLKQVREF